MVIIIIPFAFWGVNYYFQDAGSAGDIAKVGDLRISPQMFENRMRDQQNVVRQQLGDQYDPAKFNTPEMRYAVLNKMINENLLLKKANDDYFRVSDQRVFDMINGIAAFQQDGKFSPELYKQLLSQQNMAPAQFEHLVRSELLTSPLTEAVQTSEMSAASTVERYYMLVGEKREVSMASLETADFVKQVKIGDDEIESYYSNNSQAFQSPETVSIEYVKLTKASLLDKISVTEDQAHQAYERDKKRYEQPETRNAAHILVAVAKDATSAQKEQARKKAEDILSKAKTAPDKFAALAKEFSQDPGSAAQGGELGIVAVGNFVKPFEKAVFDAKESSVVGPVETEFGYHIIKVTIHPARQPSFDEVKNKVINDLKQNQANDAYNQKAADFVNKVREQTDSFAELSKKLDVPVSKAEFLTRSQIAQLAEGKQQLADAVFAPDSLSDRQNTDAIEIGSDAIISARVIDHKSTSVRPLEDVKPTIRKLIEARKAFELARDAGEEKLAQLKQGKSAKDVGLTFGKAVTIGRQQQQPGFTAEVQAEALRLNADKLPVFLGAAVGQSRYTIYHVEKSIPAAAPTDAEKAAIAQSLRNMKGSEAMNAYIQNLRSSIKVEINQAKLDAARGY